MARAGLMLVPLLALFLAACGDDGAKAEESAAWLRQYTRTNPPNQIWKTIEIKVADSSKVVMEVLVRPQEQVMKLNLLSKTGKVRIVQMACPAADAGIWKIMGGGVSLWVNLNNPDGYVIGGTCKH